MSNRVSIEINEGIAFVTLTRGDQHNSMDFDMLSAVVSAQKTVRRNKSVRSIILRGDGPSFCSGLDFKTASKQPLRVFGGYLQLWKPWRNVFQTWSLGWRDIPVPVIAVMHGACFGAGLQLALGADIRICTADAQLSVMEAKWGLVPDMGGIALMRELVAVDVAKELTMTGRIFNGTEAKSLGLVTHIDEDPLSKALELCQEIATRSPDSVGASKKLIQSSWVKSESEALQSERLWQRRMVVTKNCRIAIQNVLNKDEQPIPYVKRKV